MTNSDMPVGFIGLGNIGAPMAQRLADWPGGLTVFDVNPDAVAALVDAGAHGAADPAEVATRSDVISLMVRNDADVHEVLTGERGIFAGDCAGVVVAIHSTIGASTAAEMQALAAPHGVSIVDAPVSGGAMGAHSGRVAVMVGGEDDAVDRCRPAFGAWADLIVHFGDVGAGTRAKLARNLLHFVSFAAAGEAERLAEAVGIDPGALGRVVRHSDAVTGGAGSIMIRDTATPLPEGDPLRPPFEHALTLGLKDLGLAIQMGEENDVDVPFARLASQLLGRALYID